MFFQLSLHIFGGKGQGNAIAFGCVRCQYANTAAIGDDEQVVALQRGLEGEGQGAVKEVVQVRGLYDTSLLECCTVDFGCTSQGACVGGGSGSTVSGDAGFQCNDRLPPSGGFHEFAAVTVPFNV